MLYLNNYRSCFASMWWYMVNRFSDCGRSSHFQKGHKSYTVSCGAAGLISFKTFPEDQPNLVQRCGLTNLLHLHLKWGKRTFFQLWHIQNTIMSILTVFLTTVSVKFVYKLNDQILNDMFGCIPAKTVKAAQSPSARPGWYPAACADWSLDCAVLNTALAGQSEKEKPVKSCVRNDKRRLQY